MFLSTSPESISTQNVISALSQLPFTTESNFIENKTFQDNEILLRELSKRCPKPPPPKLGVILPKQARVEKHYFRPNTLISQKSNRPSSTVQSREASADGQCSVTIVGDTNPVHIKKRGITPLPYKPKSPFIRPDSRPPPQSYVSFKYFGEMSHTLGCYTAKVPATASRMAQRQGLSNFPEFHSSVPHPRRINTEKSKEACIKLFERSLRTQSNEVSNRSFVIVDNDSDYNGPEFEAEEEDLYEAYLDPGNGKPIPLKPSFLHSQ